MWKPRFRIWTLMILVPIAALVILAGHDLIMMGFPPDDDSDDIQSPWLIWILLLSLPCVFLGLFTFVVVMANRGDPPSMSITERAPRRFQFTIYSFLIVVLVLALMLATGLWIARNQAM
jgi:hypothetical protein